MHSAWKLVLLVIPLAVMACGQSESAESGAEAAPATALPLTVEVNERLQLTLDCELELNGDQLLLKQVSDYPLASEQLQLTQQQGDTLGAKMARVLELLELEERDVALHLRARHQQKDTYVDLFVSRAPQVELPTILSEMAERRGIQGSVLSTNEALAGALPGMFDVQLRADELGDCRHWGFRCGLSSAASWSTRPQGQCFGWTCVKVASQFRGF